MGLFTELHWRREDAKLAQCRVQILIGKGGNG